MSRAVRRLLAAAALLLVTAAPAAAQKTVTVGAIDFAKAAIASGNDALARAVLMALVKADPAAIEPNFLLAEIDIKENRLDAAIARFRHLLRDHPDLVRVRLDYALALFRKGEDKEAEYNFQLALAGDLPETVRDNVMNYLHAIRARRRYEVNLSAALAPDTNINTGTGLNEITLFGLPFKPSESLKQKSGVGAQVALSGEYRYPLAAQWRWRSGAVLWRSEYPGGPFDDMILRAMMGPQYVLQNWDLSALGIYTRRWYGNADFDEGGGGRIEASYHGFERWRIDGDAEFLHLDYPTESFQTGDFATVNLYPNVYLPIAAYFHPILGFYRQTARDPAFADRGYRLGAFYHQELPHDLSIELQGEMFLSYYDGVSTLFGTTRRDQTVRLQFNIYRRDWLVFGFNPVFSYIFTRNASNQSLFAYRRNQFEIGFTKEF